MTKKITVIGGGHGCSVVLSGLASYDIDLAGVISMADDGGSTGRLRTQMGIPAVGDIRQCLARLCNDPELAELFSYRFSSGDLEGHSLGNLFLAAGYLMTGSLGNGIDIARTALGVSTRLIPATDSNPYLLLEQEGKTIQGVHEIATSAIDKEPNLKLTANSEINDMAASTISESDLIVIAPGHFYCSILPALLVGGVVDSIKNSKAKVVFICNLTSSDLQNKNFGVLDYVSEIERLLGKDLIDIVLFNTSEIPAERLKKGETQVKSNFNFDIKPEYKFIGEDILDREEARPNPNDKIADLRSKFRHDKVKVAKILSEIL